MATNITDFPTEILFEIILDCHNVLNFCLTCKKMSVLLSDVYIQSKYYYDIHKNDLENKLLVNIATYCYHNNFIAVRALLKNFDVYFEKFLSIDYIESVMIWNYYVVDAKEIFPNPDIPEILTYHGHLLHYVRDLEIFKLIEKYVTCETLRIADSQHCNVYKTFIKGNHLDLVEYVTKKYGFENCLEKYFYCGITNCLLYPKTPNMLRLLYKFQVPNYELLTVEELERIIDDKFKSMLANFSKKNVRHEFINLLCQCIDPSYVLDTLGFEDIKKLEKQTIIYMLHKLTDINSLLSLYFDHEIFSEEGISIICFILEYAKDQHKTIHANGDVLLTLCNVVLDNIKLAKSYMRDVSEQYICEVVKIIKIFVDSNLVSDPDKLLFHYIDFLINLKSEPTTKVDHDLVKSLIRLGCDFNKENERGQTCLSICLGACHCRHISDTLLDIFFEYKDRINVNKLDSIGNNYLVYLFQEIGTCEEISFTIKVCVPSTERIMKYVKILVEMGININHKNKYGRTCLHYCCQWVRKITKSCNERKIYYLDRLKKVIRNLIEMGANPSIVKKNAKSMYDELMQICYPCGPFGKIDFWNDK